MKTMHRVELARKIVRSVALPAVAIALFFLIARNPANLPDAALTACGIVGGVGVVAAFPLWGDEKGQLALTCAAWGASMLLGVLTCIDFWRMGTLLPAARRRRMTDMPSSPGIIRSRMAAS